MANFYDRDETGVDVLLRADGARVYLEARTREGWAWVTGYLRPSVPCWARCHVERVFVNRVIRKMVMAAGLTVDGPTLVEGPGRPQNRSGPPRTGRSPRSPSPDHARLTRRSRSLIKHTELSVRADG
jgi:hypothetical protein